MKAKNVDTIKTLISVAHTDGNYLEHCWLDILKCVSQLELAQLIGSGGSKSKSGSSHPSLNRGGKGPVLANSDSIMLFDHEIWKGKMDQQRLASLHESMEEARSQSMVVAVDRIFTTSIILDGDAIVHFVRALCQVSMEELMSPSHPRMFSLQKIVEISYYNMDRIRLQWSRIWQVLGEHFNQVGCKHNEEIACFAIDSLRQLSMKFLEKGEPTVPVIRDMIVHCVTQMVSSKPGNIKSGWKNIFSVLHHAAADHDSDLVELSFSTTTKIITQYFNLYFTNIIESFQDSVKCLAEFACNGNFPDVSMEAIRLIRIHSVTRSVRTGGRTCSKCSSGCFDDLKLPQNHMEKAEWMTTTCSHALFSIVDVMTQYFDVLGCLLLDDVYGQLKWCITQDNEQLARSGTNCLENLILTSGEKFDTEVWKRTCKPRERPEIHPTDRAGGICTERACQQSCRRDGHHEGFSRAKQQDGQPKRRRNGTSVRQPTSVQPNISVGEPMFSRAVAKCTVQLELIQAVDNIVFFPAFSKKEDTEFLTIAHTGLLDLVRSLLEIHNFCKSFDLNDDLKLKLSESSFRSKKGFSGLLIQETHSLTCAIRMLFRLYCDPHRKTLVNPRKTCCSAYAVMLSATSVHFRRRCIEMPGEFRRHASALYQNVCQVLTVVHLSGEVKNLLRWFFVRCGETFHIIDDTTSPHSL
ncbi:Brefeldin A-inhibited guanine nucleotide-exchange protein 2 [Hypsibius exemplaris]|uniref:Brefeldin A-inhibited guanine nucleotide-exchange protein 2 n=1 Tax=Hypsibius exemplaris TaxID=2072580 RepID=A0A1W0WNU1_HYPEX|nr:Brefeldin A-inhibited guanine nucleotide-exchange protein 2 [Hypsibius exemplaris]